MKKSKYVYSRVASNPKRPCRLEHPAACWWQQDILNPGYFRRSVSQGNVVRNWRMNDHDGGP